MIYSGDIFSIPIILLAVVCVALVSIVWSTLRLGISPMPSSAKARHVMLVEGERAREGTIVDLGSGWGTLAMAFARQYPNRQVVGYELSFFPWFISIVLKHILVLDNLVFYRRNFLQTDLNGAAIILCYLHPEGMTAMKDKLSKAVMGGAVVISNTFALPDFPAAKVVRLDDFYLTPIYVYHQEPIYSMI